jgi:hypothetical protein
MKRLLCLAVLGLALCAAPVKANGFGPGWFTGGINVNGQWGPGAPPCPSNGYGYGYGSPAPAPVTLGPWYNYWPLEAHFQVPAHPQYPYWPAPQTLPNGAPAAGSTPAGWNVPTHHSW